VRPPSPQQHQPTKPQVPATYDADRHDYEPPYDYPPPDDYDHEPPMRRESKPPPPVDPMDYQRERDRRTDRLNTLSNTVYVLTALIALTFVLHIVFVLTGANGHSGIVSFTYFVARVFVLGFGDVFTPSDAKIGLVLNYGLAAIIYVVVGRVVARALRRR
jgi:hypothetical protein